MIPYGRQQIDENDIASVVDVLHSDWLTTGPKVTEFEEAVARFVGAFHGVAVSSGTAGLHSAMYALDIGPGDEVIVPAMTFAATANCVVYQGGIPVFADVDPETLLIDPEQVIRKITPQTKAVISVDYAGHPCAYEALRQIAEDKKLFLVADGCHALGAELDGHKVGTLADLTIFSFHPVKHITTGEGGMVVTGNSELAEKMRRFRNHGISTDHQQRKTKETWYYEMEDLGFNYRISDMQCGLGISQLRKLPGRLDRRQEIAGLYNSLLRRIDNVGPLAVQPYVYHAYHLYVVRLASEVDRYAVFQHLRDKKIGVNVHYLPVHLHPFYQRRFATGPEMCPAAEAAYEQILSLPIYPGLTDEQVEWIVSVLQDAIG